MPGPSGWIGIFPAGALAEHVPDHAERKQHEQVGELRIAGHGFHALKVLESLLRI